MEKILDGVSKNENNDVQGEVINWFYEEEGKRKGEVTEEGLIDLINSGTVTYGTSVWREGFPDWLKVENTDLRRHLEKVSPPPLKGDKINNTVVWILAFAPIIGIFIEGFIAGIFYGDTYRAESAISNGEFWYLTLILNIVLCVFDERNLKSAGQDTAKFKGWVWLVPVYLYQRSKQLNQNLGYFSVWIVCFILMMFA